MRLCGEFRHRAIIESYYADATGQEARGLRFFDYDNDGALELRAKA
jgi:hypothetical protein